MSGVDDGWSKCQSHKIILFFSFARAMARDPRQGGRWGNCEGELTPCRALICFEVGNSFRKSQPAVIPSTLSPSSEAVLILLSLRRSVFGADLIRQIFSRAHEPISRDYPLTPITRYFSGSTEYLYIHIQQLCYELMPVRGSFQMHLHMLQLSLSQMIKLLFCEIPEIRSLRTLVIAEVIGVAILANSNLGWLSLIREFKKVNQDKRSFVRGSDRVPHIILFLSASHGCM